LAQATLCKMGTSSPPPKEAEPPQFSAHVCCGQTARWIKMPLATEGGGIVLDDGNQLPHGKGHSTPYITAHFAVARSPISAAAEPLSCI